MTEHDTPSVDAEARARFWRNLVRVMTVQIVTLILLWLLQRHYLV